MENNANLSKENREKVIVQTSFVGIGANVVLAGFKAFIGMTTNSIAITLDSVNNLSDAVSSVITILGAKLSGKAPDKKHPFGYGRIEYLSQLVIAAIVLYAGITSFTESVKKIIHPEVATYGTVSIIILVAAIIVKLLLGIYVKKKGNEVNSGSLIASGTDAFFDSILSLSVLASAVIYMLSSISLEAYVGVILSIFIVKSGFEMIRDAIDEMVGVRISGDLSKKIKKTIAEESEVRGVYDLILNNYGPDRYMGSVHVEIADTMTAGEIDAMTRRIAEKVYLRHTVIMTAIGIYSANTGDKESGKIYETVRSIAMSQDGVMQMHGFFVDENVKSISLDLVVDFTVDNRLKVIEAVTEQVKSEFPDYSVRIALDSDISD